MIQFNLLPDIKANYIKAQRTKRLVMGVAFISSAAAVGILVIMLLFVFGAQKKSLSDLNGDIKKYNNQLNGVQGLDKILTIQNQLNTLPGLYEQRPAVVRLFTYIGQVTPTNVSISKYEINFEDHTISITGAADKIETVNKFVDTMKFTTYQVTGQTTTPTAFKTVVLTNFGRDVKGASYQVDVTYDPPIFDEKTAVTLNVPKIITTRSETEQPGSPNALFAPNQQPAQ